jgi:hypothetical protein
MEDYVNEKSSDTVGNGRRELPACNLVPKISEYSQKLWKVVTVNAEYHRRTRNSLLGLQHRRERECGNCGLNSAYICENFEFLANKM